MAARRLVTCHPDRKHYSKGLCERCYALNRSRSEKARSGRKLFNEKHKEKIQAAAKIYRDKNREKRVAYCKEWERNNKARREELNEKWAEEHPGQKAILFKEWVKKNPERVKQWKRELCSRNYKSNIVFKLITTLRNRINSILRIKNIKRCTSALKLVGCDLNTLKSHLEAQFQPGMTWENHGEWHIDHIKPCASFDLTSLEEQRQCFHYSNFQPLWAEDNLKKGVRENYDLAS